MLPEEDSLAAAESTCGPDPLPVQVSLSSSNWVGVLRVATDFLHDGGCSWSRPLMAPCSLLNSTVSAPT